MPSPGLSLVGFFADKQQAINHLTNACVPAVGSTPGSLVAEWMVATMSLGAPIPGAGNPDIQPIPASHAAYVQQLLAQPVFQSEFKGCAVKLVEIDPVLAYQATVDSNRSAHHCGGMTKPPTLDELLQCCLPLTQQSEQIQVFPGVNSLILKARSLNIRHFAGFWNQNVMGVQFGVSLPYVHVVRYGGKCYLFNGYHRAVGARLAGATHMPCILRDVPDRAAVGMQPPDFFAQDLLDSANPPTVGHFTQGRAIRVSLRQHSRILHVSWAEHALPDE